MKLVQDQRLGCPGSSELLKKSGLFAKCMSGSCSK